MSGHPDKTKDEAAIYQLINNWAKAARNEDMDGVLANHANDVLMFDVPMPLQSKGIEAYKETWEFHFSWSQKLGVFDVSELNITAGRDIAFCTGIIHCAGKNINNDKEGFQVRLTMGLQKINNQWMIKHEHHSLPAE